MSHAFHPQRLLLTLGLAGSLSLASSAGAAFVISEATDLFAPSFRGETGTTYFGWSSGNWDGNPEDLEGQADILNPVPNINPGSVSGNLLVQAGTNDLVSGSNNLYSDVASVNNALITLTIPTDGTVGLDGYTTIIIQGYGFGGFGFALDAFQFGDIAGVSPEYLYGMTAADRGQWWAKWDVPGNAASYDVSVTGYDADAGVLSVTDLSVDTLYSSTGFSPDSAVLAVPEPASFALGFAGLGLILRRRRGA